MSSSYHIYTELKCEDGWHCIDPWFPKADGQWVLTETYFSGSRTYFGETFDKLREIGVTNPQDISEEILKFHPEPKEQENDDCRFADYARQNRIAVPFSAIRNALPSGNQKQHCGVYHKDRIFEFENGERDDLFECEVSAKEYTKMPEEIRSKVYKYYEWDEPWGWVYHFRILENEASKRIATWKDFYWKYDESMEARLICFCY